jgi:predicted NAD/FAD-binding protein
MSYSSSINDKTWCSGDFFRPSYYLSIFNIKFLIDIFKFNKLGRKKINDEMPISEWLNLNKFSKSFAENYIYPMSAAIWSMNPNQINNFPTNRLLSFFNNHGLLDIFNRPKWYSIKNGSSSYIKRILNKTNVKNIKLSKAITIQRDKDKIHIIRDDVKIDYDYVIFTCNTKQISQILIDHTKDESEAYSYFEYLDNKVVLHNDSSFMPKDRSKWSSWNSVKKGNDQYVTYWMNNLQKLNTNENIYVTLGIFNIPNSNSIFRAKKYDHIVYNEKTIVGQEKIENLQGKNRLFYAGAYLGYGFHEDGVKSGMKVAQVINNLKE